MNLHTLKVLEYDELLLYLQNYTDSEVTRKYISHLTPMHDFRSISSALEEVTEYRSLLESTQFASFDGPPDISAILIKSRKSGIRLHAMEILSVVGLIRISTSISQYFKKETNTPRLQEKSESIVVQSELKQLIERSIDGTGAVLDKASDALFTIRSRIKRLQEKLRSRMESVAVELHHQGYLQDPLVMIRNGRFVLPVKNSEYRQVPGVVHDRSSSGMTLFVEPQFLLTENNELARLYEDEIQEIDRILEMITAKIGHKADEIETTASIVMEMDFIQAKARMAQEMQCAAVQNESIPIIHLLGCRNPLLVLHRLFSEVTETGKKEVIPIDMLVGEDNAILVITGPNTGGKTVALKTIGLVVLMHQSGLHVPCSADSRLGVFSEVFADIGDEQSLVQSLSTFSGHLKNIIEILKKADSTSLVLLDELGAGTDPAEGSALGITILSELLRRKTMTVATTHHNEIKAFAFTTPGIENAAVAFDPQTLQPVYRLIMGQIGNSNALNIAQRLGFPGHLLEDARSRLSGLPADLERMLQIVEKERQTAQKIREKADSEKARAKNLRQAREDVLQNAQKDAKAIVEKALEEADLLVTDLRRERDRVRDELKTWKQLASEERSEQSRQLLESLNQSVRKNLFEIEEQVSSRKKNQQKSKNNQWVDGLPKTGQIVYVDTCEAVGKVIAVHPARMLTVEVKGKRLRMSLDHISKPMESDKNEHSDVEGSIQLVMESSDLSSETIPLRLNLLGLTTDEATDELDHYLEKVYLAGIPEVTIIHGFGTGRLADAVVRYLKKHPFVSRGRRGEASEGGGGVTVVEMKVKS